MRDTPERSPAELRHLLVEIHDEVRGLPDDAFAQKHELQSRADRLRAELRELLQPELDQASDHWAERAGHKGSHTIDEEVKLKQAGIPSPIDN